MRLSVNYLLLLTLIIILVHCQERISRGDGCAGQKVVLDSNTAKPAWVEQEAGVVNLDGQKYIWFKGEADSRDEQVARNEAEEDAKQNVTKAIQILIRDQFGEAWQALGIGITEDLEKIRERLVVTRSSKTIRGYEFHDSYKVKIGVAQRVENGKPIFSHLMHRVYVRFKMPYIKYVQYRDEAVKKIKEANLMKIELIKKIEKVEQELAEQDKSSCFEMAVPDEH